MLSDSQFVEGFAEFRGSNASPSVERVHAIDTLRGIAVLYSICELQWLVAFQSIENSRIAAAFASLFRHSAWHGFTLKDFGFPGFILIAGVSIALANRKLNVAKQSRVQLWQQLVLKSLLLFGVGFFLDGGFTNRWPFMRFMGVLQRIACCVFAAGAMSMLFGCRRQLLIACLMLLVYWTAILVIPVPGYGAGDFSMEGNLVGYVDKLYLPGIKDGGTWDTFGILGTAPSAAICIIGVVIGEVFQKQNRSARVPVFTASGCMLLFIGFGTSFWMPVNRHLWTPPYVFYSTGSGVLFVGIVYQITEIWRYRRWTFPFIVVGRNALFAFAVVPLLPLREFTLRFVGGDIADLFGSGRQLVFVAVDLTIAWILLHWMYARKMFVKF